MQEVSIEAIAELMSFERRPKESIDECIARFETARMRAMVMGGMGLNVTMVAWIMLMRFRIPGGKWTIILVPTSGMLP
eukprot:6008795-Heterocapsa_arctica.AAC.1